MTYLSSRQIAGTGSVNRSQAETSIETVGLLPAPRICADYWLSNASQPFLLLPFSPQNFQQWITVDYIGDISIFQHDTVS